MFGETFAAALLARANATWMPATRPEGEGHPIIEKTSRLARNIVFVQSVPAAAKTMRFRTTLRSVRTARLQDHARYAGKVAPFANDASGIPFALLYCAVANNLLRRTIARNRREMRKASEAGPRRGRRER